ncbi:protein O-mannosyl-transferase TMTC1-like [Panulirus ornatus]|uniref:protein O-mannosyl-transferase TMTC1-like n=1 Tax=Panulirus ornatus TaxID=150431 RepID=UPI003A88ACC6
MKPEDQVPLSRDILHNILVRERASAGQGPTTKFWSCIRFRPETVSRDAASHHTTPEGKPKEGHRSSETRTTGSLLMARKEPGTQATVEQSQTIPGQSHQTPSLTGRLGKTRRGNSALLPSGRHVPHSATARGSQVARANAWSWQQFSSAPTSTQMYLVLAATSVVIYANGLAGEYVHDDLSAVLRNPDVQGTRPLWKLFLNDFWGKAMKDPASHKSYRPLTILTFRLSHWMWGNSCLADHAVNVLLHICVTLLYARTLLSTLRLSATQTLASSLVFATHPVHTEAVTGVVGRADLLAAGAFIIAFTGYDRSLRASSISNERLWVCWSGLWACVGVLCKEHAITVVGVCVAWDLILNAPTVTRCLTGKQDICAMIPLMRRTGKVICLGLFVVLLRLLMMRSSPVFSDQDNPASFTNSTLTRFLTFSYLPAQNAWLLLCPASLSYDWQLGSVPLVTSLCDVRNLASLALYSALLFLFLCHFRCTTTERRVVVWSLLVLCFPFVPASNLLFRVGFVVAERLLYIPSLGWCTVVGVGTVRVARLLSTRRVRNLLLALLLAFCLRTAKRNLDWRSREALFTSGLRTLPHNAKMHYNFANLQRESYNTDLAITHYREAVRLWWSYPSAHNNLGTLLLQKHQVHQAEWHFTVALRKHPKHPHAARNLAMLWRQQGRIQQAVTLLESVFVPEEEEAAGTGRLLADLHLQEGRTKEAEDVFLNLSVAQPTNPTVLADYAAFLHKLGRSEAAARYYEAALSLDSTHTRALTSYAALMNARDSHVEAHELYTRALARTWDPDTATALARLCILMGQLDQANTLLTRVTVHQPGHITARIHMAQVRLQQKQYLASENLLQEVLKEAPKHHEALYHLSLLFSATNRSEEALEAATEAARTCVQPQDLCALLHAHHADILHTLSLLDAAVVSYQLAVRMEPALARAHLNLGAIYHTQGRYNLAWEHYRTALTQDPTNTLVRENMEKLQRAMKSKSQGR